MDRSDDELLTAAESYAKARQVSIVKKLGNGEDAYVWTTSALTAVKSFYREKNYRNERDCYLRLQYLDITELSGFAVPSLVDYDDYLMIVEMGIVGLPRILDFGKAYLNRPADYPAEALADSMADFKSNYRPEDWEKVLEVVDDLASIQIFYYDLKPGNVQVRAEP